jgi:hypothetical protein
LPLRQLNGSNSARQLIGSNFFQLFKKVQTTYWMLRPFKAAREFYRLEPVAE